MPTLEHSNIIRQTRRAEPMITYQNGRKQARVNWLINYATKGQSVIVAMLPHLHYRKLFLYKPRVVNIDVNHIYHSEVPHLSSNLMTLLVRY